MSRARDVPVEQRILHPAGHGLDRDAECPPQPHRRMRRAGAQRIDVHELEGGMLVTVTVVGIVVLAVLIAGVVAGGPAASAARKPCAGC